MSHGRLDSWFEAESSHGITVRDKSGEHTLACLINSLELRSSRCHTSHLGWLPWLESVVQWQIHHRYNNWQCWGFELRDYRRILRCCWLLKTVNHLLRENLSSNRFGPLDEIRCYLDSQCLCEQVSKKSWCVIISRLLSYIKQHAEGVLLTSLFAPFKQGA